MGEMSRGQKIMKWVRANPYDYFKCLIFKNVVKLLVADRLEEVDFFWNGHIINLKNQVCEFH